jgi:PleD family two-component response regulator
VGVLETLFETADSALYRSKNLGRNRVTRADFAGTEGKSAA